MTGERAIDRASLESSLFTASRMRTLLLAALESPAGGMRVESAADASWMLDALGQRVGAEGEGLLEEAIAPTTSVPGLVRIKEAAKVLLARADRGEDREAAVLLYLVAIAAALARYGLEISSQRAEEYRERFECLAQRHAGFAVGEMFHRAAERIRQRGTA
jgi:hypothetical protein